MSILTIQKAMMKRQLEAGIAVEMEHTSDPEEAKKIALDHLREDPLYYQKLAEAGLVDEPEAKNKLVVRMEKAARGPGLVAVKKRTKDGRMITYWTRPGEVNSEHSEPKQPEEPKKGNGKIGDSNKLDADGRIEYANEIMNGDEIEELRSKRQEWINRTYDGLKDRLHYRSEAKKYIPDLDEKTFDDVEELESMIPVDTPLWNTITSAQLGEKVDPLESLLIWSIILDKGPPKAVIGWRYGDIPDSGVSHNYRDDKDEKGVSFMQIKGGEENGGFAGLAHREDGTVINVCTGFLSPWTGSDDEPLLIRPKVFKDIGDIRKSQGLTLVLKALDTSKLVRKQVTVNRGGKTFQQMRWVKPGEAGGVEQEPKQSVESKNNKSNTGKVKKLDSTDLFDGSKIKPNIAKTVIDQREFEDLMRDFDVLASIPDKKDRQDYLDEDSSVYRKLKKSGITHINAYHVTSTNPEEFGDKINGSELTATGRSDGYTRDKAVYTFLDLSDLKFGLPGVMGTKNDDIKVVKLNIPLDRLSDAKWDGNFNVTYGTYSAIGIVGDIPSEYIDGYLPIKAEWNEEKENFYLLPSDPGKQDIPEIRKSIRLIIQKSLTWSGWKLQGRTKIHGMDISIENKKGSTRRGVDKDGHKWATKMHYDYGYCRGTVGVDKDHLDCYIGPDPESTKVFVIHQNDPVTGKYDEDKVMLGFSSATEAKNAYLKQYDRPGFFGSMDETDIDTFKAKVFSDEWKGRKVTFK